MKDPSKQQDPVKQAPWYQSDLMKAIRREPVRRIPIWLMRQAGRYMAEYRSVREQYSFLELCRRPQICAEVMSTAVKKLNVDAAIIFSDLLLILEPMGFQLEFSKGDGPVIRSPYQDPGDWRHVQELEKTDALNYVFDTVAKTREIIDPAIPVIGFVGAPFTLVGYMLEGGSSRNFLKTKRFMYTETEIWHDIMAKTARSAARYLNEQITAGAQVVQIFDSWVGILGVEDYRRFVLPHVKTLIQMITSGTPIIYFGTGNPELLPVMAEAGDCVLGVDWRIPLDFAWKKVGENRVLQGNMDPALLLTREDIIRKEARRIINLVRNRPGFIFNLGHGILQETPISHVQTLVDEVHRTDCIDHTDCIGSTDRMDYTDHIDCMK